MKGLLDLPEVDHEGKDGKEKDRERMACWIYRKWIMTSRMRKVKK